MKYLVFFLILLLTVSSCSKTDQKISNLKTFAKAYGYVKYFHPGDEANKVDWAKFSAYGSKEIVKCISRQQLVNTLNKIFNPIAPSVKFSITQTAPTYDLKIITPENQSEYRLTYWQHRGVSIGMKMTGQYQAYKSVRVNRINSTDGDKLFDYQPDFKNILTRELEDNIYCQVPLTLYCNDKITYPQADSISLNRFLLNLNKFDYNVEKLSLRLGNIINVYNVFQHFYPYFDVLDVNWDSEFNNALLKSFIDKTPEDHLLTLQRFTAHLKDGHINVNLKSKEYFSPPITWEWIEGKLVITKTFEEISDIHVGDIVTNINGISPEKYFEDIYPLISAGTKGWLNYKANYLSLVGDEDSKIAITINDISVELVRKRNDYNRINASKAPGYKRISNWIWYLNMSKITMDTINKILPELTKSKAIICDARGYPASNHDLITHLMRNNDTTSAWMQIPQIIYPDQDNIIGYEKHNWISMMKAKKPYLGDKKIIYIIDGRAISYAESCLGYIEGYKLAQIVGQPSAGTNGNINPFDLPGGYTVSWTGMKVLKHNGSQHHGIGIVPDIFVSKTIKGVKEGRDEFLEKAIELAEQ
jgi:hypothetical protein